QCRARSPSAASAPRMKPGCQDTSSTASQSRPATTAYAAGSLRSAAASTAPPATGPALPRARQVTACPAVIAWLAYSRPSHAVPPRIKISMTALKYGCAVRTPPFRGRRIPPRAQPRRHRPVAHGPEAAAHRLADVYDHDPEDVAALGWEEFIARQWESIFAGY